MRIFPELIFLCATKFNLFLLRKKWHLLLLLAVSRIVFTSFLASQQNFNCSFLPYSYTQIARCLTNARLFLYFEEVYVLRLSKSTPVKKPSENHFLVYWTCLIKRVQSVKVPTSLDPNDTFCILYNLIVECSRNCYYIFVLSRLN